jgi:hypothetical protein
MSAFVGKGGHAFLRREGSLFDLKRTLDGAPRLKRTSLKAIAEMTGQVLSLPPRVVANLGKDAVPGKRDKQGR